MRKSLAVGSFLLLAACGTTLNTFNEDGCGSGVPPRVIYGGVRTDVAAVSGFGDTPFYSAVAYFDFPFSFALDTAFLPMTLIRELLFPPAPVPPRRPRMVDRWP